MLRLTVKEHTPEEAVLAVDGWVSGEEVGLLALEGARLLPQTRRLVLDIRQLRGIDAAGIDLLKAWRTDGLTLCNGSPFVTSLLETHGLEVSNRPP